MCGRYAMGIRLAFIRNQLQQHGQPVDEAADDDDVRQTYNFAPGSYGAVYRADTSDHGGVSSQDDDTGSNEQAQNHETHEESATAPKRRTHYKLQSMKWGLIPFWTKRSPDYGSMLKTINCRDDSLIEDRGMWTSMKKKKRCVVICQGFYEWLKKGPTGKDKVPYYIRRKDGDLMFFAGLWDCVQYEGTDEKLYTYTVITTSSNPYLKFLHDRMPVILEPGSPEMATWLDPHRVTWSKELQSILKPYEGELECYPVSKEVGKVGNNSPDFIIPVNSKENKSNIANFFTSAGKSKSGPNTQSQDTLKAGSEKLGAKGFSALEKDGKVNQEEKNSKGETMLTTSKSDLDIDSSSQASAAKRKRASPEATENIDATAKLPRIANPECAQPYPEKTVYHSPTKTGGGNRKMRSATSNGSAPKQEGPKRTTQGTQRITNFFKK